MKQSVTKKAIQTTRDNFAKGVEGLDQQLTSLKNQEAKLSNDRLATLGAVQACDRLLESLAPKAPATAP